jgi:hypothetical protein
MPIGPTSNLLKQRIPPDHMVLHLFLSLLFHIIEYHTRSPIKPHILPIELLLEVPQLERQQLDQFVLRTDLGLVQLPLILSHHTLRRFLEAQQQQVLLVFEGDVAVGLPDAEVLEFACGLGELVGAALQVGLQSED